MAADDLRFCVLRGFARGLKHAMRQIHLNRRSNSSAAVKERVPKSSKATRSLTAALLFDRGFREASWLDGRIVPTYILHQRRKSKVNRVGAGWFSYLSCKGCPS